MDISNYMEGQYVSVEMVNASPTKKLVITSAGEPDQGEYKKPRFEVEIDGKQKYWSINKSSAKYISDKLGTDTKAWLGKVINLQIETIRGKECVVGIPDAE